MALNICLGLHVNFKLHCFYSVLFVCMYVIGINPVGWGGGDIGCDQPPLLEFVPLFSKIKKQKNEKLGKSKWKWLALCPSRRKKTQI